jgi:hypothetical protein
LDGVQVRLTWTESNGSTSFETVTIGANNVDQFHTVPRFVRHESAAPRSTTATDGFSATAPSFNWNYTLLHVTQANPLAGQSLRLGIRRPINQNFVLTGPTNLRNPIFNGRVATPFFEDRILLNNDDIFDGFSVQLLYSGVPRIQNQTGDLAAFNGDEIYQGHVTVPLSIWNLNEQAIVVANNYLYANDVNTTGVAADKPEFSTGVGTGSTLGTIDRHLMGIQHRELDRGWMHIQIGNDFSAVTSVRFPLPITMYPVREVRANQESGSWSNHFQFRNSVPTAMLPNASDWWIDEIFNTAGFTFTVYYGHTLTTQPLTFEHVQQSRARGFNQAQIIGGVPNFFVEEVEGISARVGWFSVSQLHGHAVVGDTFPNQVINLQIPVWEWAGEARFVDKENMHPFHIQVEGTASPTNATPGPFPLGVVNSIRQTYDLQVQFTRTGSEPEWFTVNGFIWNDGPVVWESGRGTNPSGTNIPIFGGADEAVGFPHVNFGNLTDEVEDVDLEWRFPNTPNQYFATPFDRIISGFDFGRPGSDNPGTLTPAAAAASGGQHLRRAFADLGPVELPRPLQLLPHIASPTN